jgi:peptidoglycan/xylan/chitin deacetylase (PgdA/CDA1 family)
VRGLILTYHSHHVVGPSYGLNDHIALRADLELLTSLGCEIVSLGSLLDALEGKGAGVSDLPVVAITFDDGPVYDLEGFDHPQFGIQPGFVRIMNEFVAKNGANVQPGLHATSFVIASPEARQTMEATFDAAYTYVGKGAMTDEWWNPAIDTGLISIANHSWDHLHPKLPQVAHSKQVRADFTQVLSTADADLQIADASRYIRARTGGRMAPFFAYPFGQSNRFLVERYFPSNSERLGLRAAFTDEPSLIGGGESPWRLPRFVCGHHWKTSEELEGILQAEPNAGA